MKKIIRIGVGLLLVSFFSFPIVSLAGSTSGQTKTGIGFSDGPPEPPVVKPKPKPPIDKSKPSPVIRLPQTGEELALMVVALGGLVILICGVIVITRHSNTATRNKK